jgi:acyl-CoA hydrolase
LITGEIRHTSSAYLTFVALDKSGQRVAIPCVIPETAHEKRRYQEAEERRAYRLAMREKAMEKR